MIVKTITYTDYNGNQRTEDFYFHLSKAEVAEMELSVPGGLANYLKKIVADQDVPKIIEAFKQIILKSYGVKSEDGKKFIKNQEVLNEFIQSEAYSELFIELLKNAEMATSFINGVIPQGI